MTNTCNYSDEYQPYIGEYDKFEYDVKLSDGREVLNCYPNAGKFHPFEGGKSVKEEEVSEIRFSNNPVSMLNLEVSRFKPIEDSTNPITMTSRPYLDYVSNRLSVTQYRRETPKIGRNSPCFCGSGKKYKNCCIKP